jgi:fatty-acyl-CoA synthase
MPDDAYARGATDSPVLEITIGRSWRDAVARHAGAEALVVADQGVRLTYAELDRQARRCARALLGSGVAKGDRVGMWAPNCSEWVVVELAAALIGAILVNVNPSYRRHELEFVLRQSGVSLLVLAQGFKGVDYAETLAGTETPGLREAVLLGRDWDAFLARADDVDDGALEGCEATLAAGEPINIQYTSGTTGSPKGATLSHRNILNNGWFIGEILGYREADRICVPVPFYHCFGMVIGNLAAFTHGSCVVVPSAAFEPAATLAAVEAERCTSLYGVPTMFIAELGDPSFAERDLSSLRTGVMAGSPCPIEVMRRVRSEMHMSEVTICYGMTETSPVSTQTRRDDPIERQVTTVGRVHQHVEVKIVDPAGRTVARGEEGELCTRGYSVMLGYWEDAEATAAAVDAERYMHTGDLAVMDDEGYVNIVGRIKDLVIRGGENISPREIEEYLYTHPAIADVQVVGVPDERYGEVVCAWVVLAEGAALDEEGVREFCREGIARFKVPHYVRFVDGFPLTVTGKVQKYRMREQEIAERGLTSAQTA